MMRVGKGGRLGEQDDPPTTLLLGKETYAHYTSVNRQSQRN